MSKAAIVIDSWKMPIFERHLSAAGYKYAHQPSIAPETIQIVIDTDRLVTLAEVVKAANAECANQGTKQ